MNSVKKLLRVLADALFIITLAFAAWLYNLQFTPHGRLTLRSAILLRFFDHADPDQWTTQHLIANRQRAHRETFDLEPVADRRTIELPRFRVHIYKPEAKGPLPVLIAYHGGGFYFDFIPMAEAYYRHLANQTGWMVVAPDYRVAPEHPYPAAVNDCYDTFKWVLGNIAAEQGDTSRIVLWGDSAGGNLAAVVTQRARTEGLSGHIDQQVLIYPAVDMTCEKSPSIQKYNGYLMSETLLRFLQQTYAGGADCRNPELSPSLSTDFRNLPPCLLVTAEFDPLHDQGIEYLAKLKKSGIATQHREFRGMLHGFAGAMHYFTDENEELIRLAAHTLNRVSGRELARRQIKRRSSELIAKQP